MKMKVDLRLKWASGLLVAAFVAAGCPPPPPPPAVATTTVAATPPPFQFKTKTGTPITMPQDPKLISSAVASRSFGTRADPFALLGPEHSFNQSQTSERVLVEIGGFATMYEPVPEVADQGEFVEPQPYRRLTGVLVGDTVSAIIVMEDGSTHLIKPGMRIPNSPWRVLSIDEEKAVLRRAGTQKPTQIIVRLETPPGGVPGGGGNPGGPGGPGGPPGGRGGAGGRPGGGLGSGDIG